MVFTILYAMMCIIHNFNWIYVNFYVTNPIMNNSYEMNKNQPQFNLLFLLLCLWPRWTMHVQKNASAQHLPVLGWLIAELFQQAHFKNASMSGTCRGSAIVYFWLRAWPQGPGFTLKWPSVIWLEVISLNCTTFGNKFHFLFVKCLDRFSLKWCTPQVVVRRRDKVFRFPNSLFIFSEPNLLIEMLGQKLQTEEPLM